MSAFNIEAYLNSLPDDIEEIDVTYRELTYLPDLSRFKKLKKLNCSHNKLVSLSLLPNSLLELYCKNNQLVSLYSLPNSLRSLWCSDNKLNSLPSLPNSLLTLWCYGNQLNYLPPLPNSLNMLRCDHNQLVSLPLLPDSLMLLRCDYNQLVSLPLLPNSLLDFDCSYNPVYNIIDSDKLNVVKAKVKILNQFRLLYYCIKYKERLRKWLWDVRENKAKEEYHPDRLKEMLEGKDINDIDF